MSRTFDARNAALPLHIEAMNAMRPDCFTSGDWASFLSECSRQAIGNAAMRAALRRGEIPNWCSECTQGYRARMLADGKCHPHKAASGAAA